MGIRWRWTSRREVRVPASSPNSGSLELARDPEHQERSHLMPMPEPVILRGELDSINVQGKSGNRAVVTLTLVTELSKDVDKVLFGTLVVAYTGKRVVLQLEPDPEFTGEL